MLNVVVLSVIMLNVVMLSVIMLNLIMLSVTMLNVVMLSVILLNVVMLSVVAPLFPPLTLGEGETDEIYLSAKFQKPQGML